LSESLLLLLLLLEFLLELLLIGEMLTKRTTFQFFLLFKLNQCGFKCFSYSIYQLTVTAQRNNNAHVIMT